MVLMAEDFFQVSLHLCGLREVLARRFIYTLKPKL